MTLYELTDQFARLLALIEDPDIDPQVIADTMEGLTGEIEDKAEGYGCVIRELEAEYGKFDAEVKRTTEYRDRIGKHIKRMKESLLTTMQVMDKPKLATEHFKFSIAKNGGVQPLKITGDVPAEYCRLTPDNEKIREALTKGNLDFAQFEERGVHLNIK